MKDKIVDSNLYYLFFDEIQNVENFEKVINSLRASKKVSIFITGSNSRLLSDELSIVLSGRYVTFKINPLSYKEVLELMVLKNEGRDVSSLTIYSYLDALCKALLIRKVNRYDIHGKAVLKTLNKYYVTDLGIAQIERYIYK